MDPVSLPPAQPLSTPHLPVLLDEVITLLRPRTSGLYVDGTVGAGGHAAAILAASAPGGRLIGLDADPDALRIAGARLAEFHDRVSLVQRNFRCIADAMDELSAPEADGILLDLGVSSMQLDRPERGFSFRESGPLDMRMDPGLAASAATLVNTLLERDLAHIIFQFGEERHARRIAAAIVRRRRDRPFETTGDLADAVARAVPGGRAGPIHPATRTFQALRIAVNQELDAVEAALPQAVDRLASGGRLAVISFHSLEDRIVKRFFQDRAGRCVCPPGLPVCRCGARASVRIVTRKPITADEAELRQNPRSRSAKLRVAEKLAGGESS